MPCWPLVCLQQEVRRYEGIVKRHELEALHADVDTLRIELLALEDELKRAQVTSRQTEETHKPKCSPGVRSFWL